MTYHITPLVNEQNHTGENPFYFPEENAVYWVDIPLGKLFRLDLGSGRHRLIYHDIPVGGFTRQADGDLLLFRVQDIARMKPDGSVQSLLPLHDEGAKRFNDVIADPEGRVFAGTIGRTTESGGLWRVERDGTMELLFRGTGVANGMGVSPDLRTFYWTDYTHSQIFRFDYERESGKLSNRELFYQAAPQDGQPDGMTIDTQGRIWSAHLGAGVLLCLSPDGREVGRVKMPVRRLTSCIFGGRDMDTLFVTTGRQSGSSTPDGLPDGEADGALYAVRVQATGTPEWASRILI
jgi:D-xylonolactonase